MEATFATFGPDGSGSGAVDISPRSDSVLYEADQDTPGVIELHQVPIRGGTVERLSGAMVNGGDVGFSRFSADGSRIPYEADQDTDEAVELFSVSLVQPEALPQIFADGFEAP